MYYSARVCESILPLSIGASLPEAFEEWRFSGKTCDHEEPSETCQLCGKEGLRYHFEIANDLTSSKLWVGSHCILAFDVGVYEQGQRLGAEDAARLLEKRVQQMRLESCLKALATLAATESNSILSGALAFYQKNKYLTPRYAFVVFWRLQQNGVDHDPSFFKIGMKKKRDKEALREMDTDRVHFFWSALSAGQRRKAMELGHSPP